MSETSPVQLGLWAQGGDEDRASGAPAGQALFRHPRAEREIQFGKALVGYAVERARRRSIGMVVGVEGLTVRAPRWVSWSDIETALRAKERWICTKLHEQRERAHRQQAARIIWQHGARVPFMGGLVEVSLVPASGAGVDDVCAMALSVAPVADAGLMAMPQQQIAVLTDVSAEVVRHQVHVWLKNEAKRYFALRVQHFAELLHVDVKHVSLSSAKTRWGSASVDGSIRLHWRLIHFGQDVIDYVVVHELAHLHEMNHSPRFWDVVRSVMPDYEGPRGQLRRAVLPE